MQAFDDRTRCVACGRCVEMCPVGAIRFVDDDTYRDHCKRVASNKCPPGRLKPDQFHRLVAAVEKMAVGEMPPEAYATLLEEFAAEKAGNF